MSPRRNYPKNKRPKSEERDISTSSQTIEEHHEGMYIVRKLTGSSSNKPYRCPGCDQVIPMATPHTVAWLEDDEESRRTGITLAGQRKISDVLILSEHVTRRAFNRSVPLTSELK